MCICLAQHWTLYITCWRLSHIWYKKIWTKNISPRTWLLVKNSMKLSDVKRKRPRPMLSDVGLLKSFAWWLCEQDLVTFFYTIPKFSTHVHHFTGIVRKSKKRTITYNCRNFIEYYGYTWYQFCFPNDLPAKPMIRINMFEYNASSYYSN